MWNGHFDILLALLIIVLDVQVTEEKPVNNSSPVSIPGGTSTDIKLPTAQKRHVRTAHQLLPSHIPTRTARITKTTSTDIKVPTTQKRLHTSHIPTRTARITKTTVSHMRISSHHEPTRKLISKKTTTRDFSTKPTKWTTKSYPPLTKSPQITSTKPGTLKPSRTSRSQFAIFMSIGVALLIILTIIFCILVISCVCFKKGFLYKCYKKYQAKRYARIVDSLIDFSADNTQSERSCDTSAKPKYT